MERHFLISETDRDGLVSYLQGRPYREVARGVAILMQLREAPLSDDSGEHHESQAKPVDAV
jgi:hypothetical protein